MAGKGRKSAGWGSQLCKWRRQSENLSHHCLVLSPVRKSHATLTLPFPKRAEPSTSETQSVSPGHLFILVTDLWCVNSESIWQHFEKQPRNGPDGKPWVWVSLPPQSSCMLLGIYYLMYCNSHTNRSRKWGWCHLQKTIPCKEFLKLIHNNPPVVNRKFGIFHCL